MRTVLPCFAVLALAVAAGFALPADKSVAGQQPDASILAEIHTNRAVTWQWQRVMGVPRTPYADHPEGDASLRYVLWVRNLWRSRAAQARRHALHPPHDRQFLCIHRFEGSWKDAHAPYYGGLQMDLPFMRRYGRDLLRRKGTADHWTPLEQIWVAERAYRSGRGFYPWPNTARICGLI